MADITANIVVSNPRPVFTDSRSFKAVANGRIYVGKIDSDPTIPSNQIPVYIENEDGSFVQISQPLIINGAGKIVYNGQLVKVVTEQGHSMAVYDAYGSQVDYISDVLKYDPDQFRRQVTGGDGSLLGYQLNSNAMHQTIKERFDAEPIYLSSYCKPSKTVDNSGKIQQAINDALILKKKLIIDGEYYSSKALYARLPTTYNGTYSFIMEGYGKSSVGINFPTGVRGFVLRSENDLSSDTVYGLMLSNFYIYCPSYDVSVAPVPSTQNFTAGLYFECGLGMGDFKNLNFKGFDYGHHCGEKTIFLSSIVGCNYLQCYNGLKLPDAGATSMFIDRTYVFHSRGTAYYLTGYYSTYGTLACDRSEGDIYRFTYFKGTIGALAFEKFTSANIGTLIRFGVSDVTVGHIYMQDLQGTVDVNSKLLDVSGSRVNVENWFIQDKNSANTPADGLLGTGLTSFNSRVVIRNFNSPYKLRTGKTSWSDSLDNAFVEINGAKFMNAWGRAFMGSNTDDVAKLTSGSSVTEPGIMWDCYGGLRYAGKDGSLDMGYGKTLKLGQWGIENRPDIHGVAGFVTVNNPTNNIDAQTHPIPIIYRSNTRPSNPVVGAIWINPNDNKIRHFAGSNWYDAAGNVLNT